MKEKLYIIKIGGNVINDEHELQQFLKNFAAIESKKILIHGGGKIATTIAAQLGIESRYIDGRRITDDDTLDVVTMVYAGLVNKKIVAKLQALQCNALGLCGADANILPAVKRPVEAIDYGWAGDIILNACDIQPWQLFLQQGLTPVASPLTHDGKGHLLNTNADTIAATVAALLAPGYELSLIYCFEKDGVLKNVADETSVIPQINREDYQQLCQEQKLFSGILPKLENSFMALAHQVEKVVIGNSRKLHQLIAGKEGTVIKL